MNLRCLVLAPVLFVAAVLAAEDAKRGAVYSGKVSTLGVAADRLGSEWTGPTGLAIDDFKDLSNQPDDVKPVAEELRRQVSAIGVVQTADFTYQKKLNPLHQITLRVFVFESEEACSSWWKKKYQYEGWEKEYAVLDGVPYAAVDSKEMSKRAVSFGNVWMTCGALGRTDDHLKVLDLYLNKIKAN